MKKNIESEIRKLILEVILVIAFTVASIPLWDYLDTKSYAQIAEHYSEVGKTNISISNGKKKIYSETFEEAIGEMNHLLITSYEETDGEYDIYLLLKLGTDYEDIVFSNGKSTVRLEELYDSTSDYIYFKLDSKTLNSKQTLTYNYYIWSKDLNNDKNIKIKFAVL